MQTEGDDADGGMASCHGHRFKCDVKLRCDNLSQVIHIGQSTVK